MRHRDDSTQVPRQNCVTGHSVTISSIAIANFLHFLVWPLPILHMLEKQSCQLYCPTTSDWYCHQPSTHSKNPIHWSILLLHSKINRKYFNFYGLTSFFSKCILKQMIVSMIKLTAPLKAFIIWSSTTALVWTGLIGVLKEVWNCYLQTINFTHH